MARCPFAEWRGPLPYSNFRSGGNNPIGLIVHHVDGSLAAADGTFNNPSRGASAHFGIDFDGRIVQWVDTSDVAYAQCMGNWQGWVSVENASDPGAPDAPPTAAQIASMGRLITWLGTPAVPATSMTSGGVGYHRQFGGPCNEAWGQTDCPGDGFVAAIPAICAAAGAPVPAPQHSRSDVIYKEENGKFWEMGFGDYVELPQNVGLGAALNGATVVPIKTIERIAMGISAKNQATKFLQAVGLIAK